MAGSAFPSEAAVAFSPFQQLTPVDLNDLATLPQATLDNVVASTLGDGRYYVGLPVTANADGKGVTVGAGLLFSGGPGYNLRQPFDMDLSDAINAIGNASLSSNVLIVVSGATSPAQETRTLEDASQQPSNPVDLWPTTQQVITTRLVRSIVAGNYVGTPANTPQDPPYNPFSLPIARVVVTQAGVQSVQQIADGRITTLAQLGPIVLQSQGDVGVLKSAVAGLLSTVSALALSYAAFQAQVLAALAALQKQSDANALKISTAATATFRGQDNFQDLSQSNPAAPGYNAQVASGLRFAIGQKTDGTFAPALAVNPDITPNKGNFLVPLYNRGYITYISSGMLTTQGSGVDSYAAYGGDGSGASAYAGLATNGLNTLPAYTGPTAMRAVGRVRTRLGKALQPGSSAAMLGTGDPSQLFAIDPTTFVYDPVNWGDWKSGNPQVNHLAGYWQDVSAFGHWTPEYNVGFINGLRGVSQPFTPSSPLMIDGLYLNKTGYQYGTGVPDFRLIVCEDANGRPDFSRIWADMLSPVTTPANQFGSAGTVQFTFPHPLYFKGGKKYHFVIFANSTAPDQIGFTAYKTQPNTQNGFISGASQSLQNDVLTFTGGDWTATSPGYAAFFTLVQAQFAGTTFRMTMQSQQLAGGIDTLDFLAVAQIPDGCSIGFEAYIGNSWIPFGPGQAPVILGLLPNNVPVNLIFNGTYQLQPVIDIARSATRCSRAAPSLDHVSSVMLPGGTVTKIHKTVTVDQWNAAVQTLTADLRVGAGYATIVQPDSAPQDVANADGSLSRSWTWTLAQPVNGFEMELVGTTTDTTQCFVGRTTTFDAGN